MIGLMSSTLTDAQQASSLVRQLTHTVRRSDTSEELTGRPNGITDRENTFSK